MKQQQALAILKAGQPTFLTGQAGAGKTYVLNQYINYLRQRHIPVAITASTGIASSHINGMTIHAWSGIGIKDELTKTDFKMLAGKKALMERLEKVKVLIIDEVSMLHAKQLDMVDSVLRHFKKINKPFGGIQVIFSGDFFQLPPIGKPNETTKDKFAFMSKAWIELATNYDDTGTAPLKICYLSEQHRQHQDEDEGLSLNQILNQIREQAIIPQAVDILLNSKHNTLTNPTHLYTHNTKVNEINEQELAKLEGKSHTFLGIESGNNVLTANLKKQVLAPECLTLKKGAKVMFVKNNAQGDYYNGTIGEVIDFKDFKDEYGNRQYYPIIKTHDNKTLMVEPESWTVEDEEGEILAQFTQLPLCLAWAITIHKSQGLTLDHAQMDLSKTFEKGQGYVALSRVRSLKGLQLLGINEKALLLDEFAQVANRRFLALSKDAERWLDQKSILLDEQDPTSSPLFKLQDTFLQTNTMSSRPVAVLEAPKKSATSTAPLSLNNDFLLTLKALLNNQSSLSQLSTKLVLAKMSVIGNLELLLHHHLINHDDIAYLRPDTLTLNKVKQAIKTLKEQDKWTDNTPKINPIFEEVQETISRQDIGLSLLFLNKE